jgi:molecular chaperone DnaK
VTREIFADITRDLLDRTEMLLEAVLGKANLGWEDIDDVLSVGGSSRMPMVSEMLERITGKKALLHDPDECVAKGAALQAALLSNNANVPKVEVGHVLSHSLGVAVMEAGKPMIDHIVPSLTRLPTVQVREGYTTALDNQSVVQGARVRGREQGFAVVWPRSHRRLHHRHHAGAPQRPPANRAGISLR